MTQIFIFGSSNPYGVGGSEGGWADILKRRLHQKMYGERGVGEKHELYNFGKPGATAAFVAETFEAQLYDYRKPNWPAVAILSVGLNNVRAPDHPDNHSSTPEVFKEEMAALITKVKAKVDRIIVVGFHTFDKACTMPKISPFNGTKSFFCPDRAAQFNQILKELCMDQGVPFVENGIEESEWLTTCLAKDGFHMNDKGHSALAKKVIIEIEKVL